MKIGRTKYKANKGARITDKEAQIIGDRINQLMRTTGNEITPKELVNDARQENSPLHIFFEWDNSKAGEKWRERQAQELLRSVTEVVVHKGEEKNIRSFFNVVSNEGNRVYVTYEKVKQEPDYIKQLIEQAQMYITHFMEVMNLLKDEIRK